MMLFQHQIRKKMKMSQSESIYTRRVPPEHNFLIDLLKFLF